MPRKNAQRRRRARQLGQRSHAVYRRGCSFDHVCFPGAATLIHVPAFTLPSGFPSISGSVDWLLGQHMWLVFLIVGVLVFAEAAVFVGFVLPGETAAVLGGVAIKIHGDSAELWMMYVVVILAAIAGDTVGYEVGKKFGPRLLQVKFLAKHEHRINNAKQFLANRGGWAVFFGRYVAFLRALMPGLAGVSRMPYRKFLFWNALGGFVWGSIFVSVGYFAKAQYDRLHTLIGPELAIAVLVAIGVVFLVLHIRKERRERKLDHQAAADLQSVPNLDE